MTKVSRLPSSMAGTETRTQIPGDAIPGDAIKARCVFSGSWIGGIISAINLHRGRVWVVAGKYDIFKRFDGVECKLFAAEIVRGKAVYWYRTRNRICRAPKHRDPDFTRQR